MNPKLKKIVLIDGNALVHRAFHALPPTLTSPQGTPTNAVYGFAAVLIKMLKELKPEYVVATFDLAGPTFRHEEFAEYKANRVKASDELYNQFPAVKKLLTSFGIPIFEKQGYEADDLIGVLSDKAKEMKDTQAVIVTGDLDTLQLVEDDKVLVFTLRKGVTDTMIYDEKAIMERYGLKPSQLVDYKGLKGDPSDNIPGVAGIGEKTASALIQNFNNLENLYDKISGFQLPISAKDKKKIKPPLSEKLIQKLQENKDMAFFSKKLATIYREIPIDFQPSMAEWRKKFNRPEVENIFKDLGFYSLVKRLDDLNENSTDQKSDSAIAPTQPSLQTSDSPKIIGKELKTKKDFQEISDRAKQRGEIVLDISSGHLSLAFDANGYYWADLERGLADPGIKDLLSSESVKKIVFDVKEICRALFKKADIKGVDFDVKLAAYILNPEFKDFVLERIYYEKFKKNTDAFDTKIKPVYIFELKEAFAPKIDREGFKTLFEEIEIPLGKVLAEMELMGIKINIKAISKLETITATELKDLEDKIYKMAGTVFNINSPQQLSSILFDKLKLKGKLKKTSKGAVSTAAAELEKLADEHSIIDLLLKYREIQKLKTTYVDPFPALIDKKTGRLHTTYNQTGTVTGRLSSQDPNLQNIPVKTKLGREFRKVIIAEKGYKLLSLDYSQLELRVIAHISKDKKMTEAFRRGEDIHARTAAEILGVEQDKVTSAMRRTAKVLNFGILYGMGQFGFQRASGVSRERAKEFIRKYMEEFSGVAAYMAKTKIDAREKGYVATIFGRRRKLPEIYSNMSELIRQAERMAINMPVQGTAADLIKMAMIKIYDLIRKECLKDEARLLLQVHDELLFEIKEEKLSEYTAKFRDIMENIYKLDVPLTVDAKAGDNWSDMTGV
jgi:DNA polymerase-1